MTDTMTRFVNARIYSMEKEGEVFSSMDCGQGRIIALGHERGGRGAVDLGGRTVIPGFTDAHCHFMPSAIMTQFGSCLSEIRNNRLVPQDLAGVGAVLRAFGQEKKNVLGFNLVTSGVREKRMPTKGELDRWLPGKIAIIFDSGGHSSSYSSAAIAALGLEDLHDDGLLTGELHEFNMGRVNRFVMKQLTPMILAKGICNFVNRLHSYGITGVHCMEGFEDDARDWSTRIFAFLAPVLPLHIRLYCQYRAPERVMPFLKRMSRPRLGGCGAWEMDGAVSAGTAAFYDKYKQPAHTRGACYYSDREVAAMVGAADAKGFQISSHAIGPRAIEPLLTALEKTGKGNPNGHRIEHFEFPTPDQARRAVDAGIFLVPQPGWAWMDHQYQKSYEYRLTRDQIRSQIPLRDIVSKGGIICGGSDSPVQDPNPFTQIRGMCDFPVPGQSISRFQAVRAYTLNSARAGGDGDERGSLVPGKSADFLVLNKDIMDEGVSPEDIRVDQLYMGGKRIPQNGLTVSVLLKRMLVGRRKKI